MVSNDEILERLFSFDIPRLSARVFDEIPDPKLASELFGHILSRRGVQDEYEEFRMAQPEPCRNLLNIWELDGEIKNGGFQQYFENLLGTGREFEIANSTLTNSKRSPTGSVIRRNTSTTS